MSSKQDQVTPNRDSSTASIPNIYIKDACLLFDPWCNRQDPPLSEDTKTNHYQLVTLAQWQRDSHLLLPSENLLGVILPDDIDIYEAGILPHLTALTLISIHFTSFTNGQGFSLAAQLRQYGFKKELRATGNIIIDQLHYLQRCGFNAFELDPHEDVSVTLKALQAFSDSYQPGW